jgi:O-antigen ligase
MRLGTWATLSALTVAAVLWPFLLWSSDQSLQTPIDHPSRYNFLQSWHATVFFFGPVHGPLLLLIPAALWLTRKRRKFWPLTVAWAALFVLSLGGTTPLPKFLFGNGWDWLTYDRFGLWAGVALAPIAGAWIVLNSRQPRGAWAASGFFSSLILTCLASATLCVTTQCQPPAVNLAPLVQFLNAPEQKLYRYFTLGFGDQLAKLSTLVSNGTPDGTYHTARTLPELRASGLGALDSALWNPQGAWALAPFLSQPQHYGARWVFVNHAAYVPVLKATGWRYRFDVGSVQAWERAEVQPLVIEPAVQNDWAAGWWGSAPLAVLVLSGAALAWRVRVTRPQVVAALTHLRWGLLALTLVLLNFWWLWPARPALTDYARIYFVYESILVYASDVTLALALLVWLITLTLQKTRLRFPFFSYLLFFLFALLLSTFNSLDSSFTLATALHWGLLASLFIMLVNEPPTQRWLRVLFNVFIVWQAAWALLQIFTQSTAVPADWPFLWPGFITATQPGSSVVQNAEGLRWLRVYGTLSHPNVFGAMMLVFLGMAGASFSRPSGPASRRPRRSPTISLIVASTIISLTFSRAAWLGLAGGLLAAYFFAPQEFRSQTKRAIFICATAAALVLVPLSSFVFSRAGVSGQENRLEFASTLERTLLIQYGFQVWQASPLTGVGTGGFVQWAAQNTGADLPFEPVHNVPLLILAETGLVGAGAALALLSAIAVRIWRRSKLMSAPEAIYAATLVGVAITMLFDHLWWTQPPARTLLVFLLGLWANQTLERNVSLV